MLRKGKVIYFELFPVALPILRMQKQLHPGWVASRQHKPDLRYESVEFARNNKEECHTLKRMPQSSIVGCTQSSAKATIRATDEWLPEFV
jgi:hypothetical protein